MHGVETLHLTSDRDRPRVPRGIIVRLVATAALLVAVAGFGAWVAAQTGTLGLLLGVVVVLMMLLVTVTLVIGTSAQRTGRLVVEQRPRSLRLPGAAIVWRVTLALLALSLVLPVLVVGSLFVGGSLEVPTVAASGSLVLLVLGVPVGVQVLRGRIRAPYLELDEAGLTHHGMNASTTVLWQDVTGLRLVADPGRRLVVESSSTPQRAVRSATPGERPVGGPRVAAGEVSLPVAFLGSDAAVVADLIQDLSGVSRGKAGVSAELRAGLATGATLELLRQRSAARSR